MGVGVAESLEKLGGFERLGLYQVELQCVGRRPGSLHFFSPLPAHTHTHTHTQQSPVFPPLLPNLELIGFRGGDE